MSDLPTHSDLHLRDDTSRFAMQFYFLGTLNYDDVIGLQRRLVYEAGGYHDGRIAVLLCEHPSVITVGRNGSRAHIRLTRQQMQSRQIAVRWTNRGGGTLLHSPGQIAVYPIIPLQWHQWTVGHYLRLFHDALLQTLQQLRIRCEVLQDSFGIWGRSGQLVAMGAAVRNDVTCHGAFINVNPRMTSYPFIDVVDPVTTPAGWKTTMGCLFAERRRAITIHKVRASLVPNLAEAFGTERYHLFTGHPFLKRSRTSTSATRHRAS